jgi:hypothetical protein
MIICYRLSPELGSWCYRLVNIRLRKTVFHVYLNSNESRNDWIPERSSPLIAQPATQ